MGQEHDVYLLDDAGRIITHSGVAHQSGEDFSNVELVRDVLMSDTEAPLGRAYTSRDGSAVLGGGMPVLFKGASGEDIHTGWFVVSEEHADVALSGIFQVERFALILLFSFFFFSI